MTQSFVWQLHEGDSPLVAAAIHDGHTVRNDIATQFAISNANRLREEDPFTGEWTKIAPTRIIGQRSRFEIDLNRPREKAVYIKPEDAWGLKVWHKKPTQDMIEQSLHEYDAFYAEVHRVLNERARRFGRFFVFDLHTYNYRREGPDGVPAHPELNPEVNIGTGTMERERWAPIVDRFITDLRAFDFFGRQLDVRENIKFRGGNFSLWIHQTFPTSGCALAIEFKKFFMDEWTGAPDPVQLQAIRQALQSTVPGVLEELEKLNR